MPPHPLRNQTLQNGGGNRATDEKIERDCARALDTLKIRSVEFLPEPDAKKMESVMKRGIIIALAIALLASAAGVFCLWAFAPDPLEDAAKKVRPGMSESEVTKLLGKPHVVIDIPDNRSARHKWVTDRVIVMVLFDESAQVKTTSVHRRPIWDRIQDLRK